MGKPRLVSRRLFDQRLGKKLKPDNRSLWPRSGVAQICNLSVSVQIVAGRDDFAERGSVSRSTLRATYALDLSERWAADGAPADHRPALLWLRRSCNQTLPLLHAMEERAGERRDLECPSPRSSPHSCVVGRGRSRTRGKKSSQGAMIPLDTYTLHRCATTKRNFDLSIKCRLLWHPVLALSLCFLMFMAKPLHRSRSISCNSHARA